MMRERLKRLLGLDGLARRVASLEALGIEQRLAELKSEADHLRHELLNRHEDLLPVLLRQRGALARRLNVPSPDARRGSAQNANVLEDAYRELERLAPAAYRHWRQLIDVNATAYEGLPIDSCSVAGHPMAELFDAFLRPYLTGPALDIGCGPQPVPRYLLDYPTALISGLDPLPPPSPHSFEFVQGVAEFLPWSDGDFDTVIAATSLDHVLLLDRAFAEIRRVLVAGGRFVVWLAFLAGAPRYDPYRPDVEPVDQFHLFHFDRPWFEEMVGEWFRIEECVHLQHPGNSSFYSLVAV